MDSCPILIWSKSVLLVPTHYYQSKQEQHLKYRWYPLMCNTTKTKLQCSGHIYNHLFGAIERYTSYFTCWVTQIKKLPRIVNNIFCFHINGRSSHVAQCVKSRIMNNTIDPILYIDTFEQQCIVIKVILQSPRLEDHMNNIGIDLSLSNRFSFEHKFLSNKIKIYQQCR